MRKGELRENILADCPTEFEDDLNDYINILENKILEISNVASYVADDKETLDIVRYELEELAKALY